MENKKVPTLTGVTIANLFFENSTRTKLSFELAEKIKADVIASLKQDLQFQKARHSLTQLITF